MSQKNLTFALFDEKFSKIFFQKITYKGYFHAIFEKNFENFLPKKRKITVFFGSSCNSKYFFFYQRSNLGPNLEREVLIGGSSYKFSNFRLSSGRHLKFFCFGDDSPGSSPIITALLTTVLYIYISRSNHFPIKPGLVFLIIYNLMNFSC
jgi:hypothetical protein